MKRVLILAAMLTFTFSSTIYAEYFVEPPVVGSIESWEREEVVRHYESWTNPSIEEIKQIEDQKERYRAVFNMVCEHLTYNFTSETISYHQIDAIISQEGVCVHYATAIRDIGKMCDLNVEFISGWNGVLGVGHAWNRITIDGVQYWSDASGYDLYGDWDYWFLSSKQFWGIFSNEELSAIYDATPEGYTVQFYTDGTYKYIEEKILTKEEKQELYEKYGIIIED